MADLSKRVILISTGGTITMTSKNGDAIKPTLTGEDLVLAVPNIGNIADIDVVTYSTKPGASLTLGDIVNIAQLVNDKLTGNYAGAIIVQGTDTIEETAFILDKLVQSAKPVIITGAMRSPNAAGSDGPANLLSSVIVATSSKCCNMGVFAVLNDEVHAARFVQKSHTSLTSAFTSKGFSPIAKIIEDEVHLYAQLLRKPILQCPKDVDCTKVAFIATALGDDGSLLRLASASNFAGIVIEAMGAGHLSEPLADLIDDLTNIMPVILATRVKAGPVFEKTYGFKGSETDLIKRGIIPAGDLDANKSVLLLRLLLAHGINGEKLKSEFMKHSKYH